MEKTITTVKNLLKKCKFENRDPYLALLDLRNTPLYGESSPASVLMHRSLRDLLPRPFAQPSSGFRGRYDKHIDNSKLKQKHHFDKKGVKPLPELAINDEILYKKDFAQVWKRGIILELVGFRSYKIRTEDGSILIRNRKFLKIFKKSSIVNKNVEPSSGKFEFAEGDNLLCKNYVYLGLSSDNLDMNGESVADDVGDSDDGGSVVSEVLEGEKSNSSFSSFKSTDSVDNTNCTVKSYGDTDPPHRGS